MDDKPRVAISIVTRNRAAVLEETLRTLMQLVPLPDEIWVYADACTDDTITMVRDRFPEVRLLTNEEPRGSIYGRDRILREATCDIVLTLDDDSHPVEKDFLARLRSLHAGHPEVGVFTFPQISEEYPQSLSEPRPWQNQKSQQVASYTNSGASYDRKIYLTLPGFVPEFIHAYEEPDYTLQCLAVGHKVVFEPSLTIRHHYTSVNRNPVLTHSSHCRNEVWSVLLRAPWFLVPLMIPFRVLRQLGNAAHLGGWAWVKEAPRWWWQALQGSCAMLRKRSGIDRKTYWRWLRLSRQPQPL